MNETITLVCGCIIDSEGPHPDGCKCGDSSCHEKEWFMDEMCDDHSGVNSE